MTDYRIEISTKDEWKAVDSGIVEYNRGQVPFTQEPPYQPINRVIRDEAGAVIAGINSVIYGWNCLYIDVLWVKEEVRCRGYGSALLIEAERIAKEKGCSLVHLDTFDFQAKDFYIKHGYEVFGVLDGCPPGHQRFYMKKNIE